jgi:hypothetical protein
MSHFETAKALAHVAPAVDITGAARGNLVDVGAYNYNSSKQRQD